MTVFIIAAGLGFLYLMLTLGLSYIVQQFPRNPIENPPDWGKVTDTKIPTTGNKQIEVWRIEPEGPSRGTVILAHGWGRNRDRMINRAKLFGAWGFTTVVHSARDHGRSDPQQLMNAVRFAEDIEAVMSWVGEPAILYGHSAGSAGAIIAATRNPGKIDMLFLEATYAFTRPALHSLYTWVHPAFGKFFAPMIISWMNFYYRGDLDRYDPATLAPQLDIPVMLIHGETDRRFPLSFAKQLYLQFSHDNIDFYVAKGAGHSDSSETKGYASAIKQFVDRHLAEQTGEHKNE